MAGPPDARRQSISSSEGNGLRSIPSFEQYLATLGRLTSPIDPTAASPGAAELKEAATSLTALDDVSLLQLTEWVRANPRWVPALALTVGLSQEKLKNVLKDHFNTTGSFTLAQTRPGDLVQMLDADFDLMRLLTVQRGRAYDFGDILVARAGTRHTARGGQRSGRRVEDEIQAIADDLDLPNIPRTQFRGRNDTAPCDLAIPDGESAQIVVAAKGFDSTGSKLSDAVTEVEKMARVRLPTQFVLAVIDGIGWKNRQADLRRLYNLWVTKQIDGMYTLASLDSFRADLEKAASLRNL
jgi:hypothetical protein